MKTLSTLRLSLILLLSLLLCAPGFAQKTEEFKKRKSKFEPNNALIISPIYTAQFPFGNMRDRFGFNSLFGLHLAYKMKKNWIIGGEASFLYGSVVRENYILDNITLASGQLVGTTNALITPKLQEMGASVKITFGKLVPFSEKYPDAGLLFLTGFGFLSHKIAINVRSETLPQLNKTYRKGYDRLSNGPVLSQFIGGLFMARRKYVSAYAGIQFDVAFTQGRRPYDFYSMAPLHDKRIDMFLGIRVGWIIPVFFTQATEKEYYYY
ncbi:MAG TPA: hypothetical protein VK174_14160 [Chitinophagales bacterium]|nr:hypothetical protein [Chitinophagales bacterium]